MDNQKTELNIWAFALVSERDDGKTSSGVWGFYGASFDEATIEARKEAMKRCPEEKGFYNWQVRHLTYPKEVVETVAGSYGMTYRGEIDNVADWIKGAIAALSQPPTHQADIDQAKRLLSEALALVELVTA